MNKISFEYWNELASQIILISSLLAGFSICGIASLLTIKEPSKTINYMLKFSFLAVCSFLITLFCYTNVLMKTNPGYPFPVEANDFQFSRLVASATFFIGIIMLIMMISLVGWAKSKKMGIFTTIVGVITIILLFLSMI